MLKGQKQLTNKVLKEKVRENPYITRQRVLRSYIKFQTKVAQRQSICMVKEWDCPDLISPEEFKTEYLEPERGQWMISYPLLYIGKNQT